VRYMLDTNICIYLMKNQPVAVAERFARCRGGDVVMSAITLAELRFGVECAVESRERNERALEALLDAIPAAPFDAAAAVPYGLIRAATRERKRDALDKLIAAHAIGLDVTLVTNNEDDFRRYPGLRWENWVTGTSGEA
jgi:tRNA(fMet)-specific endonuclease VapC